MRKLVPLCLIALSVCGVLAYRHAREDPLLSLALGINDDVESQAAFAELLRTMRELEARLREHPAASAEGYRALLHGLQHALVHGVEQDRERPRFHRTVTPTMKLLGDNPDALYHRTVVRGDRRYRIDGRMDGAKYVSITLHEGPGDGSQADGIVVVRNSTQFDVDPDGAFRITLGPEAIDDPNHIQLTPRSADITVRHYYEDVDPAAARNRSMPVSIEPIGVRSPPAARNDDARVAAAIRRVTNYLRDRTIVVPAQGEQTMPPFASAVPNQFPRPAMPGDMAFSNADAAYAQAPFLLRDDEALVIRGRFPDAVMANVMLWNRGKMDTAIPFGPFLAGGALLWLAAGPEIARWYFGGALF